MSWGNPWMLLMLALPVLGIVVLRRLIRQSSLQRWPAMQRVAIAGNKVRAALPAKTRPAIFLMLAIALTLIAAARPQWGEHPEASFSQTREVMIALDLSRSMLTEDVAPSRLDHAKQVTEYLLDSLQGESVGLVVFAGTAFVQVPLSPDYHIVREFMPSLDTEYLPRGGSNYSSMLDAALDGFSETPDRDRYLIVLSDGESSTQGWEERLGRMAEREIHVVSIGLGTRAGAFIPDLQNGGYLADANGDAVHSKLMPATLEALARRTNGKYVDAASLTEIGDVKSLLAETVETGRKGRASTASGSALTERFQWFLLVAVALGLISLLREFQQRPKPRQVRRDEPVRSEASADVPTKLAAGIALLIAFGSAPPARAHFDADAEFQVQETFDSNPTERLRAIADHLAQFGYDAFDLRLMVEATLRYGIDAQRTGTAVSEGVLRDAIDATQQGERLDTSIADWPYYRSQLTAMLEPPAAAAPEDKSQAPDAVMDEENERPIVTGDSSNQSANDSFGEGASAKTDAALGDLTPDSDVEIQRGKKPKPPAKARKLAGRSLPSGGDDASGAEDPILKLTRRNLDDAARRDSPGRLHQLLATDEPTAEQNKFDH